MEVEGESQGWVIQGLDPVEIFIWISDKEQVHPDLRRIRTSTLDLPTFALFPSNAQMALNMCPIGSRATKGQQNSI